MKPLTIAVDAMGGEHGPAEIVRAAADLSLEVPRVGGTPQLQPIHVLLVGDAAKLAELLYALRHDAERIAIAHAPAALASSESLPSGLVAEPAASISMAAQLCAAGQADALVSAGNTQAAVTACQRYWQPLLGVHKGALAAVYPTEVRRGEKNDPFCLLLDVGATLDVAADDLCTFAVLGAAYAARISQNPRPKVALLSTGAAASCGSEAVILAHEQLSKLSKRAGLHFIGNIEGVDISRGIADVVVCGGFVGNVVLNMLEGLWETGVRLASLASKEKLTLRAGLSMLPGGISRRKELSDWKQYGGAPLLGFDRLLIQVHGNSQSRALQNAIKLAAKSVCSGVLFDMTSGLEKWARLRKSAVVDS